MANVILTITPVTPALASVTVSSVASLLSELADDSLDEIVVANGTYHVSAAASQRADSLWIGAKFASRTRPILIRPATPGGVAFDGDAGSYFGGISFEEGAHHQTWDGFNFTNMAIVWTPALATVRSARPAPACAPLSWRRARTCRSQPRCGRS